MEALDSALMAARAQFAITISFHIVLAAFTIGLANFLLVLEALWLKSRREIYLDVYRYWLKVFALNVAVGTASGLILEYQFGLNWSRLAVQAGDILGPLMFYAVAAFFLEAGFLGIMLFGLKKVGPRLHFFATGAVAMGSLISAFWILSASSWMHNARRLFDDGGRALSGRRLVGDHFQSLVSLSPDAHDTGRAAGLGDAGGGGQRLAVAQDLAQSPRSPAIVHGLMDGRGSNSLVQILVGDLHGEHTLKVQPQKVAAIEGSWTRPPPGAGEPLRLFGWPDMSERRNHWEVAIPRIGSLYLRHDLSGTIAALDEFAPGDIPPVPPVFFAFRLMVGLGLMMFAQGIVSLVLRCRKRLYIARGWLWSCVLMAPAGFVAMISGWTVTEVGRQPFTVYGLLRTADSVSRVSTRAGDGLDLGDLTVLWAGVRHRFVGADACAP
ncbi:cytochrome ubiquinol oxidase subunit I [Pseudomonas hormoni]